MSTAPGKRPSPREELERVLSSACFVRSEGLSRLLRFLVEQRLDGKEGELKEIVIGVQIYGRKPDYDPKLDSTVRSEMTRLRARLAKYYSTEGVQDQLIIELPKGAYVPGFRQVEPTGPAREPWGRRRWLATGIVSLGAVLAAVCGWWLIHQNYPISIAVLPLVDLSKDGSRGYIADGLTSEIISELSIIDGLTVRSQTSSFALKGNSKSAQDAGRQLSADYILEGSLIANGSRVRIDARLIRTRDDVPVWSEKFECDGSELLGVQEGISLGIVNRLRLKLGRGRRHYETSPEAYDLYLRARALSARRFPGDPEIIDVFEQAIVKDPSLAPAYAGLAAAYAWQSFTAPDRGDHDEKLTKMRTAADKAIQLDPLLAEAHSALGTAYARKGQWQQAEHSLRRAIQIDPNLAIGHDNLTWFFLFPMGRLEEAIEEARTEVRLDPLSPMAHYLLATTLISAGRYDEAASQCGQLPEDFNFTSECLGRAQLGQGRSTEAIRVLAKTEQWGYLAFAYGRTGQRDEVEVLQSAAPVAHPHTHGHFQYALAYAGLQDKNHTIDELESWAGVGPVRIGFTLTAPEFAFIRNDPRVKALRKKVGLPN